MSKFIQFFKGLPWKSAIKSALSIIVPAAVGSAAALCTGCSSLTPSAKTQTMSLYAIGVPGIAIVTQSHQNADNKGDDENSPKQTNPVTVKPTVSTK